MRNTRLVRLLVLLAVPLLLAASCEATRDLEGVDVVDPDSAIIIRNADQFPNLSILCFEGTAIVTTTREAAPVIDENSQFCREPGTE